MSSPSPASPAQNDKQAPPGDVRLIAADGAWTLGDAAGPAVAGALVEWGGHRPLAVLALVGGLSCMFMLLGVLRRFESGEGPLGEEPAPPGPT